jgi:hypothetical protein
MALLLSKLTREDLCPFQNWLVEEITFVRCLACANAASSFVNNDKRQYYFSILLLS